MLFILMCFSDMPAYAVQVWDVLIMHPHLMTFPFLGARIESSQGSISIHDSTGTKGRSSQGIGSRKL